MKSHTYQFEVILEKYDGSSQIRLPREKTNVVREWFKYKMIDVMVYHQCDFQNFKLKHIYDNVYEVSFETNQEDVYDIVNDMIYHDEKMDTNIVVNNELCIVFGKLV